MSDQKIVKEIDIDPNTQEILAEYNRVLLDAKFRIELILKTYLNAKGIKGQSYQPTPNFDKLILVP